jgi:hypothetical protein
VRQLENHINSGLPGIKGFYQMAIGWLFALRFMDRPFHGENSRPIRLSKDHGFSMAND